VQRRALPVAIAAVICGAIGLVLPFSVAVSAFMPPSFFAMNMAFCSMLMGVGILFYARGTSGTRIAEVLCIAAILLGMGGVFLYSWQSVQFRGLRESMELGNVQGIAQAAQSYAAGHDGTYPGDLLVLLEEKRIAPQSLESPYGRRSEIFERFSETAGKLSREDLRKSVETASDYIYLGADLHNVPPELAGDVIVATSNTTVLRTRLALAFAGGEARFIDVDEAPEVMRRCNEARRKMGLGILRPPPIIQEALDDKKTGGSL
jgi:hypothetical protein